MPFSIALQDQVSDHFREASHSPAAPIRIVERKGGAEITAAVLIPLKDITAAEMKMLAVNLKDYWNQMPLEYRFGVENRELKYGPRTENAPLVDGITFRFHFKDTAVPPTTGNSVDVALMEIDPAYKGSFQKRIDSGDFAIVPRQGTEVERRSSLRGRDPALNAPPTTPSVS